MYNSNWAWKNKVWDRQINCSYSWVCKGEVLLRLDKNVHRGCNARGKLAFGCSIILVITWLLQPFAPFHFVRFLRQKNNVQGRKCQFDDHMNLSWTLDKNNNFIQSEKIKGDVNTFPFLLLKKVNQLYFLSKHSKLWPYLSSLKFPAPFDCWQMSNQHLLTVLQIQVYPKKYSQ